MASSAELAVAKASLSATLFRADPTACSRDEIDHFFSLLNSAISQCSPPNVQKCKQWILANLVPSNGRIAPLGKYLCALCSSFASEKDKERAEARPTDRQRLGPREPSARRKRLHILYILSDVFYHVKYRDHNDNFADKVEAFLPALIRDAAAFPNCPKHVKKIRDLISIWEEKAYFSPSSIAQFRAAVEQALVPEKSETSNGTRATEAASASAAKAGKEAPFIMPAMHGDPTMPWYDLPAGNWLPVLEPNSTRPMKPSMIKPLQLAPGQADKTLVEAVNKLLVDVENLYSREPNQITKASYDIDQMGEVVEMDEINGDIINGETYYGWSRAFCEKMRARRNKARSGGASYNTRRSGRSYSRSSDSRSRSRSRGLSRRAHHSRSRSRSGSRSRSSSRPRMKRRHSSSDSRSPPRRMPNHHSRSQSRSRSRSRGQHGGRNISGSRSRSRSPRHSPSFSPEYSPAPDPAPRPDSYANNPVHTGRYTMPPAQPPQPPIQMPGYGGYQTQGAHFPVPPPPPPSYSGQWPPPPPPPLQQNFFNPPAPPPSVAMPLPAWSGGWAIPPPPPVGMNMAPQPMDLQQQQQHSNPPNQYGYGRGGSVAGFHGGRGGGRWH